jgi:hypothetical protein
MQISMRSGCIALAAFLVLEAVFGPKALPLQVILWRPPGIGTAARGTAVVNNASAAQQPEVELASELADAQASQNALMPVSLIESARAVRSSHEVCSAAPGQHLATHAETDLAWESLSGTHRLRLCLGRVGQSGLGISVWDSTSEAVSGTRGTVWPDLLRAQASDHGTGMRILCIVAE